MRKREPVKELPKCFGSRELFVDLLCVIDFVTFSLIRYDLVREYTEHRHF